MNHKEALDRVRFISHSAFHNDMDRVSTVDLLVREGLNQLEANIAFDLIPIAFGWALLRKMGVEEFPSVFILRNENLEDQEVPVSSSHIFTAALSIAFDIFERGYTDDFSKDLVTALCFESADVNAVSKALKADPNIDLVASKLTTILYGYTKDEFQDVS
ncbi:MAG: hypothetical protein AAF215_04705 [Cyanobacteria bacterium P01_A01_bin.123]